MRNVKMENIELARSPRIGVLNMVTSKRVGFIGSAFSCIDITSVLYNDIIIYDNNMKTVHLAYKYN